MKELRFGKEWQEDILSIPKNEMLILFKRVCIRLLFLEKDLVNTEKQLDNAEKELTDVKKELKELKKKY